MLSSILLLKLGWTTRSERLGDNRVCVKVAGVWHLTPRVIPLYLMPSFRWLDFDRRFIGANTELPRGRIMESARFLKSFV